MGAGPRIDVDANKLVVAAYADIGADVDAIVTAHPDIRANSKSVVSVEIDTDIDAIIATDRDAQLGKGRRRGDKSAGERQG